MPESLYSDLTGKPMQNCVNCDRNIIETGELYVLEKAFRYYPEYGFHNTIFEYIMCLPCAEEMQKSISQDSQQRIQDYFAKVSPHRDHHMTWQGEEADFEKWTSECMVKGTPKKGMEEYQICATCEGENLVFNYYPTPLPYMLSHEASNEIAELLSAETLEEYNRFVDDNFGLPPEFKKALKDSPVLV